MKENAGSTRHSSRDTTLLYFQIQSITTSGTIISYALYVVLGFHLPEAPWLL